MKTLAISFGIGAFLGSSFIASTSTANKQINSLNLALNKLSDDSKKVENLKKLRKEIIETSRKINESKNSINKLNQSLKEEGTNTEETKRKIKSLGMTISKLQQQYKDQKEIFNKNKKYLKSEGIEVNNLTKSYNELQKKIKASERVKKVRNFSSNLKDKSERISSASSKVLSAGTATTAFIYPAIQAAIKSESGFADVKKQFDFSSEEEAKKYRADLEKIITEKGIAISLDELYSAAANAGQAGIDKKDSLEYIEMASKMGVAFGISREEAAKTMFEWKNAFNKPLPELKKLIDQVNYLGNTTGANSPAISEFVNRIGNIGSNAGFNTGQIAAIGATLIEQGMAPEIAATGAKKIMGAMTKGFAATKGQKEIYEMLGLDSETLAKEAQKDAEGTVVKILSRIKNMPKEKQGAILTQLFGEEGMRGASGLLNNIERLQRNFSIIKNDSEFNGSSDKEFQTRQATLENQIQILKEMATINLRNFGELLLPTINSAVQRLKVLSTMLREFQDKHPKAFGILAKAILGLGTGLTVIGTVGKVIGGIGKIIGTAGMGISSLMNPVGLTIIGITALITAGYLLYKNWDTVKKKAIDLKNKVVELVDKYWYMLGPLGHVIKAGKSIYENWDTIKLKASELKEKIVEMVMNGINNFNEFKEKAVAVLGIPFDYMAAKIENLKNLGKDLKDYFLEIFEEIKNFSLGDAISGGTSFLVNKAKEYIPGFATGGFVNSPTLAMVGEGGASEAIIPLTRDSNSMNLWEKTGRLLGAFDNSSSSNNTNTTFNFTYSPVVNAKDAAGVKEVLENDARMSYEQFKGYFDRYQRETYRRGNGR